MRKVVKASGAKDSTYELISDIDTPISSLNYPAGRYGYRDGVNAIYGDSHNTYIGISKIHFRKKKRSLSEGMSKPSKLIQNLRDPDNG